MTNAMMNNRFYGEELDLDQLEMVNGGGFWEVVDKITDYVPVVSPLKKFAKQNWADGNNGADWKTRLKHIVVGGGKAILDFVGFGAETLFETGLDVLDDFGSETSSDETFGGVAGKFGYGSTAGKF